ncbi:class I adenylate-forming enzyme family protein [Nocardiopsis rhodophaea]|uniref:class I adenylate-forming enzyme family protein n=1 Tax=Nocardiopsis rhodophaea TaxID=280238 RepID=UPI0031CF5FFA
MEQVLKRGRQRHAGRTAIIEGDRHITYSELDFRTDNLASAFLAMGIDRGDRIAVVSHNRTEVVETYFALGKIGAAAVPIHYGAVSDEVAAVVKECGVTAIVGAAGLPGTENDRFGCPVLVYESQDYQRAVSGGPGLARRGTHDDELAFILHTSATTGRSKGVCLDQNALRYGALGYLAEADVPSDAVLLHCGPLSHGAMIVPFIYLAAGATVVLMPMFTPAECVARIRGSKVTDLFLVPDMLRLVLNTEGLARAPLSTLREVIYGAAPMPRSLLLAARSALNCGFRQVYALTEAGAAVATLSPDDHDHAPEDAVGRAIMGTTVRSHDDRGDACPPGEIGELWVSSPAVMRGYWHDQEATAEVIRGGWLRTGDLGSVDKNGYVRLAGRQKDVIVRGGQKVFPAEVERVLRGHHAVRDACVVGIPSEEWGELPFAYAVASGDSGDPAELVGGLRELARGQLATYKRPVGIEIVAELPRNAAGKVDRRRLRARVAGGGNAEH